MNGEIIVAILSLVGTLVGAFGGIVTANKLVAYRLERLEEKVNEHNQVIARTFVLEGKMDAVQNDVSELKEYHKPTK